MKILQVLLFTLTLSKVAAQTSKPIDQTWQKYGEVKNGQHITEILYRTVEGDTTFLLGFNNQHYQKIISREAISFKSTDNALEGLYLNLSEALQAEKGKTMSFILGDDKLIVSTGAIMGAKYIEITVPSKTASFTLTQKQLDKLFNKKRR